MGTATRPRPIERNIRGIWPDMLYLAMVVVSIAGLAYVFLER